MDVFDLIERQALSEAERIQRMQLIEDYLDGVVAIHPFRWDGDQVRIGTTPQPSSSDRVGGPSSPKAAVVVVIDGAIIDCSRWIESHPGGASSILRHQGADCTTSFRRVGSHSGAAVANQLASLRAGDLFDSKAISDARRSVFSLAGYLLPRTSSPPMDMVGASERAFIKQYCSLFSRCRQSVTAASVLESDIIAASPALSSGLPSSRGNDAGNLGGRLFPLQVASVNRVSPGIVKLAFSNSPLRLGSGALRGTALGKTASMETVTPWVLEPGGHINIQAPRRTSEPPSATVMRPYSPVHVSATGGFDLFVKIYPGGQCSQRLATLKAGDTLLVTPCERPSLLLSSTSLLDWSDHLVLVAGGTGIAPLLNMASYALALPPRGSPPSPRRVTVVVCFQTLEHVMLVDDLERLLDEYPSALVVHVLVSRSVGSATPQRSGNVRWALNTRLTSATQLTAMKIGPSTDLTRTTASAAADRSLVVLSGPPRMTSRDNGVPALFNAAGWSPSRLHVL